MNKKEKIVIIGAVAAGTACATRIRRLNEFCDITLIEKNKYISYASCGLPYFLSDTTSREDLEVLSKEKLKGWFNIDTLIYHEALEIDSNKKIVIVKNLDNNELKEIKYDKLILATGSIPFIPKGFENSNYYVLKNIEDAERLKFDVLNNNYKKIAVIGAGAIGLEVVDNLYCENREITIIEKQKEILPHLDKELAYILSKDLEKRNIKILRNTKVENISKDGKTLTFEDGSKQDFDCVVLSVGFIPNTKLAVKSNIKLGETKGILVDKYFETSISNIYAIGDCIEKINYITKEKGLCLLAGPANYEGHLLADILYHKKEEYTGYLGTNICKVFECNIASIGLTTYELEKTNKKYLTCHINISSHASYYPGAKNLFMKLIFSEKGDIYGMQVISKADVSKHIDIVSLAIKNNLKVHDLKNAELCYAPPFSSAKSPVNFIGYVASNMVDKLESRKYAKDYQNVLNDTILDVRTEEEFLNGHIKNSINIPLHTLRKNLDKLDKNKKVYIYCQGGKRGYFAARILNQHGYETVNLDWGYAMLENQEFYINGK